MPRKTIDTGILQTIQLAAESEEDLYSIFKTYPKSIHEIVDFQENEARQCIKFYGHDPDGPMPDNPSPLIREAFHQLFEVKSFRIALAKRDLEWAAWQAYMIGVKSVTLAVRPHETAAKRGHKVGHGSSKGRRQTAEIRKSKAEQRRKRL